MAEIIPFPATRRVGFIERLAWQMAEYRPDAAERTLHIRLDATYQAMLRRQIPADVALREVRSLEHAVRAELWGIVMLGDGGSPAAEWALRSPAPPPARQPLMSARAAHAPR
jgi:hypothetical protein